MARSGLSLLRWLILAGSALALSACAGFGGTDLKPGDPVRIVSPGTEHQDRHRADPPQSREEIETIHSRHRHIKHCNIEATAQRKL